MQNIQTDSSASPENINLEVEIEIVYSEQDILKKLATYQLNPQTVFANLKVNLNALKQAGTLVDLQKNHILSPLHAELQNWQTSKQLSIFSTQINQLVFLWLNALQDGASLKQIFSLLKSFELKSLFSNNSASYHCFLLDLVAETTQKYQQFQLDYVQNIDSNTQLPNGNQLTMAVEKATFSAQNQQHISVLSIHFQLSKNNPIYSQSMSLSLSKKIAQIIRQNMPKDCQLFYSGNLQFDILVTHLSNEIQKNLLLTKLQRAFEHMQFIENESVLITPFTGCATYIKSSAKAFDIVSCARLALERALSTQQSIVAYSDDLKIQLNTQKAIEEKVLSAFDSDSLALYLQPVMNIEDASCVGAELLLRWPNQVDKTIYPGLMIEILNKAGKGKLFTRWLINSACRHAAELRQEHQLDLYLTLNLRAEDLYDVELPHMLLQAMALWRIKPKDIVLEVTENGVLEHNETTDSVINTLSQHGFKLALDDFGTGYSSLSRLRTMPIDIIKIDQSFVRDIKQSKDDCAIVKSIAELANSLGKEIIAEGVEDKQCLDLIKKIRIKKCQGYFFAKPMPFDDFIIWAKQH